mgnify:CR=1 FL=1
MKGINVYVLGTMYTVETHKVSQDKHMQENNFMGYCWYDEKKIVIPDVTEKGYFNFESKEAETVFYPRC